MHGVIGNWEKLFLFSHFFSEEILHMITASNVASKVSSTYFSLTVKEISQSFRALGSFCLHEILEKILIDLNLGHK